MATEIQFDNLINPLILDLEGLLPGVINETDPFFIEKGIESVTVTGGIAAGDILQGTAVQGNSLASVNGQLAVVAPFEPIDDGTSIGLPEYTINFSQPLNRFGATVTDQFGSDFVFDFLSNGSVIDTFNFQILNGNFDSATRYVETISSFDAVKITHRGLSFLGSGGYGIDNITFERFSDSLIVDTLVDENDGDLSPGDVSLREAIAFIADGGTVRFAPGLTGTILLAPSLGQLEINKSLTINGPGADIVAVSGGNQVRVFYINDNQDSSSTVRIDGLTISDGNGSSGSGGGIASYNEKLIISNSIFSNNSASSAGAINPGSNVTLTNVIFSNNSADFSAGGIFLDVTEIPHSLTNVKFLRNVAGTSGGGIYSEGDAILTNTTFIDNTAGEKGGGIFIRDYVFTLINSTVRDNTAQNVGGGIANEGTLFVDGSTILNNSSGSDGGGIDIVSAGTIINSLIDGNTALRGGGIGMAGNVQVINTTIINNSADRFGGGINNFTDVEIINSTISNNSAPLGSGVNVVSGNAAVANSIIAENMDKDVSGSFISKGHNLIGNSDGSSGFNAGINGDIVGNSSSPIDPLLGPLINNGGLTLTQALLEGSPAIDSGLNANAVDGDGNPLEFDQRGEGFERIINGTVDIGAFEVQSAPPLLDDLEIGLYDTDTDTLVTLLKEGIAIQASLLENRNLTIAAIVPDDSGFSGQVESMFLELNDGQFTATENVEPYALFGDAPKGNFRSGGLMLQENNTMTFDLFSRNRLRGEHLGTVTRNFSVVGDVISPPGLNVGFYDTETDSLIAPIANGGTIQASLLAGRDLTIAAFVPDDSVFAGQVESIFLDLNEGQFTAIENVEPYALFGDAPKGNFRSGGLVLQENNTIAFDLYSKNNLRGDLLDTVTVDFTVAGDL